MTERRLGRRPFLGLAAAGGAAVGARSVPGLRRAVEPSAAAAQRDAGTDALRPDIHPREDWAGGLGPTGRLQREAPGDTRFLLVHHSAGGNDYGSDDVPGLLQGIYSFHVGPGKRWPDIAYNFVVDRHGGIWEGRAGSLDAPVKGDATGGSQGFAILCCLLGNHHVAPPTAAAVDALARLLAWLGATYRIDTRPGATTSFVSRGSNLHPAGAGVAAATISGHRDMSATACPGDFLYRIVRDELPARVTSIRGEVGATAEHADVTHTPTGAGYWLLRDDGSVDAAGDAVEPSGPRTRAPGERFIGLVAAGRRGYWTATDRGRVVSVGTAPRVVDLVDRLGPDALDGPVAGAASTPDGTGFWMVGADGGVFTLGSASFHGSIPGLQRRGGPLEGRALASPIAGLAPTPTGRGYWMVAEDGGVFTFGDATFHGSIPGVLRGRQLAAPIVGMVPEGAGYFMVGADGGVFTFGEARFLGSDAASGGRTAVALSPTPDGRGYLLLHADGRLVGFGTARVLPATPAPVR